MKTLRCLPLLALSALFAHAQSTPSAHKQVLEYVDQGADHWKQVSKQIWDYAELGYHEEKSSAPVSYTHLDVYKRQYIERPIP